MDGALVSSTADSAGVETSRLLGADGAVVETGILLGADGADSPHDQAEDRVSISNAANRKI